MVTTACPGLETPGSPDNGSAAPGLTNRLKSRTLHVVHHVQFVAGGKAPCKIENKLCVKLFLRVRYFSC